ncbi:efflux transporter, outer membrane factor (OMF) lipoprotein, NodT family [Nannocystis exedens]|uniref:Efflux transporter, outer membrane factor (OMF) lipoprotein, NodT family n=1 Tax=Nannocystis exedens TaxID=54 RepID=A0A1I2CU41_9BACT|nr:TolC family protein [Nannocystis exedens]PCC68549.1 RND transporter [Nannocystis exedens]SFE71685.1 efflux transporter, outer membrane factor (OMF) lipoprotein, NodT family [Nannocystis exedens]
MNKWWSPVTVMTAACALSLTVGCASLLGNNKAREANKETPESFGALATGSGPSVAVQEQWDQFFADPDLRGLIEEALENNQQLNIQLQEIIISQNNAAAIRGDYIPRLDAGVGAGLEKPGEHTAAGVEHEAHGLPRPLADFRFGFVASWETDIWSSLRNARKAAIFHYEATIQERNFLVTEIVAELAKSYYDLVALDLQIEILDRNIELQKNALEVVKLKKLAARDTELGVQRFQAEVLKNQGRRFALEQQRIIIENRINFLVGRFPQPVTRNSRTFDAAKPDVVATGLPSDLLDNRPDVKAAELRLEAAKLDTRSAKARFYPSLRLDAGIGFESFNLAHLIDPRSLAYNLAGGLVAPLLNRAAIKAEYRAANARQVQAVFDYERSILQAYTDVYNQLTAISNLKQRYEQLSGQVDKLHAAIEVSKVLYQSAHVDYYEVLMTVRDSLEAEMDLVEAKKDQMQAVVAIYQALGGGWRQNP